MHRLLGKHPLFSGLTKEQLVHLDTLSHEIVVPADYLLIKENSRTTKCYIIIEGSMEIFKAVDNKNFQLSILTKNDIVGEMSIICNEPRSASAKTLTTSSLLVIDMEEIKERSELTPLYNTLVANIANCLSKRLRDSNQIIIDSLSRELSQAKQRIAFGYVTMTVFYILSFYALSVYFIHHLISIFFTSTTPASVILLTLFATATFITLKCSGYPLSDFGVSLDNAKHHAKEAAIITLPFLIVVLFIKWDYVEYINALDPLFDPKSIFISASKFSWSKYLLFLLSYALLCPLQEFIARCGLQGSLQKFMGDSSFKHRWFAIITANIIFISVHSFLSLTFAFATFIPGLFWGWLYDRQKSIVGISVSHIMIGVWALFIVGAPYSLLVNIPHH